MGFCHGCVFALQFGEGRGSRPGGERHGRDGNDGGEGKRSFGGNRDGKDGNDGPEGKRSFGAHGIGKHHDKEGDENRYVNRKFYRERNNPIVINKDMEGKDDRFAWKGHKEDKEERRPSKGGGGGAKNEPGTGIIFARGVDQDGKPQLFVRGP
ncbi:hypothetical protein OEZ85_009396 [Tetradesmus obliquus]|uniref:Hyaluronan/mRNA-binding protein domain-containing protein n=1 Tax=Tetradesmus obliquus TaxID=3088 RepID=A0ABY8UE12_TETOB|nr:hypothetical protein OEZ85_009396 [Tetradesmus obliquus]